MNRIHFAAVSTALIMCELPLVQARAKSGEASAAAQGIAIFEQIEATSDEISEVAWQLGERSKGPVDSEVYRGSLDMLKSGVNAIGRELKTLDAERASLAPWEVEALDRTTSLMMDVAASTENAIETYNSNQNRLWTTSYPAFTEKASEEAHQVKIILSGYLKLAKAHQQMDRLEPGPSTSPQL